MDRLQHWVMRCGDHARASYTRGAARDVRAPPARNINIVCS